MKESTSGSFTSACSFAHWWDVVLSRRCAQSLLEMRKQPARRFTSLVLLL